MSRRGWAAGLALALAWSVTGCTVPRPRADDTASKVAVTRAEAEAVYDRYRTVRQSALELLDEQPLTAVESGPVLAIDAGALQVARRLLDERGPDDSEDLRIRQVLSPRLSSYPLWYVVVADDRTRELTRVQVFARATSTSTWQLVASPEMLPSTPLPEIAVDETGALTSVEPADSTGIVAGPQTAMDDYADRLATGDEGDVDSFVQRMREVSASQSSIPGVRVRQTWQARPVEYALRTQDGGALVFATLRREDSYDIAAGRAVDWPQGSEQEAFLSGRLSSEATLSYFHQMLVYVPPTGGSEPFALGQYGGVVEASGS